MTPSRNPDASSAASTTEGLPVSPSMAPGLVVAQVSAHRTAVDVRVLTLSALAIGLGLVAAYLAQALGGLIGLVTGLAFYGRWLPHPIAQAPSPADHHLGLWVILVPVAGAVVVGLMARFGSKAIRGHGIPEAMEQVLTNESRIPARMTVLKPLSAAISIGTGGPFGAEGPIIASGGALGSLIGQLVRMTADERKTLLAAGAAAGMSATFGSPVSAVLLAMELLLFEYRPRSIIPVALASAAAAGMRLALVGPTPAFDIPALATVHAPALIGYIVLGAVMGVLSVAVTRAVYGVEDAFERLPVHWMWWPAIGALPVGLVGAVAPHTLGVGYDNIEHLLAGSLTGGAAAALCALKFTSWVFALGSGTSGGTLAPLLTVGGGAGALLATAAAHALPALGIDPRVGALVGMAALFAGASRAFLASVVFAFEVTRQAEGLLPLLGGCGAAFAVSSLLMRHSIMTEKIARRGTRVVTEYVADDWSQRLVGAHASRPVVALAATLSIADARARVAAGTRHQGFPVVADATTGGPLVGIVMRHELLAATDDARPVSSLVRRRAVSVREDDTLRDAADLMTEHDVGRLPVVSARAPHTLVGMLTRSDLLRASRARV